MSQQLNDANLITNETDHNGQLPSLQTALDRTGQIAGMIYRQVIEKKLDALQGEINQLNAKVELLEAEKEKTIRRMGASSR